MIQGLHPTSTVVITFCNVGSFLFHVYSSMIMSMIVSILILMRFEPPPHILTYPYLYPPYTPKPMFCHSSPSPPYPYTHPHVYKPMRIRTPYLYSFKPIDTSTLWILTIEEMVQWSVLDKSDAEIGLQSIFVKYYVTWQTEQRQKFT